MTSQLRPARRIAALALAGPALVVALVTGCSDSGDDTPSATAGSAAPTSANNTTLTMADAWVKVADKGGMTAVFGTITNPTDKDITVSGGATQSAAKLELHEVVGGKMQPKQGGFVVPAHGSVQLAPGHDHLMLMGLEVPVRAGDAIAVTLNLSDGASLSFQAIGKTTNAGAESYQPTASPSKS